MTKIDPIIAVKDVAASAAWYQNILGFKRLHGGNEFAVLATEDNEIVLCLHQWGAHDHPTMTNSSTAPGNGLILYLRTNNMTAIRQNVEKCGSVVEEDIHLNSNSLKMEFSLRDPDGYYLIITDYHEYKG